MVTTMRWDEQVEKARHFPSAVQISDGGDGEAIGHHGEQEIQHSKEDVTIAMMSFT